VTIKPLVSDSTIEELDIIIPTVRKESPFYLKGFELVRENLVFSEMNFIEVNLADESIRVFQGGALVKEVPILTKGDPQRWGGTAAGIYNVVYKNRSSFSLASEVYMPWAVNFYGKYFFHGEPYYPGGRKLYSEFSGGCIRLYNKDAKAVFNLVERGTPVLVIDKESDSYEYPNKDFKEPLEVSAQSFLAADLNSGFVFAEKDSQKVLPIASITKLMTAIVVAENIDLERSILVRPYMLDVYGSTEGLEEGKRFGVVELFYPLLIESSNDAAEVLNYFLGRDRTLKLMNEKAKSILMTNTEFTDPSGYDPGNISCAQGLFYLARYVLNNRPPLLEITKGKKVISFGSVSFDIDKLWNKNVFINDPTFVGGKTGFTIQAQYTALFIFRFTTEDEEERNVVIILLGSEDEKRDTQRIYMWLQRNYFKEQNE